MKKIALLLCLIPFVLFAQQPGELIPPKKINYSFFLELNTGVATPLNKSNYIGADANSIYLNKDFSVNQPNLFLNLKFGFQLEKRHAFSVGIENIALYNNVNYIRENVPQIGLVSGGTTKQFSYLGINFHYDFTIYRKKWFSTSLGFQIGMGLDYSQPNYWDHQVWVNRTEDNNGNIISTLIIDQELKKKTRQILIYGFNWSTEFEIVKDKFVLGTELKLVHAPYKALRSYALKITDNQEPPIVFSNTNTILNLNIGIKIRYLFGSNINEDATGF